MDETMKGLHFFLRHREFGPDPKATIVAHGRPGIASNAEALC